MSIFNFWRKRQKSVLPPDNPLVAVVDMTRLDGFSCNYCGAGMYDDRTDCLVCKTPYPLRAAEVAKWHREVKWGLVKNMSHDDAARVLKDITMGISKNQKLPLKEALNALFAHYDV